ncbi:MAG TPA: Lrp/AsnC family transcriptional regulator [Candidatus Ornithomonoglobus intestinigallinarum]|jgi:DNA-binding Lrp family transcriptional regulator|uniref:Lrp/AsnC family transcriptional regulator n=1 Tax=Candidatus Ornithomonoglobus intestinigallinarum TaxID=2840894 RepID=A0A9D1KQ25_9FIRM|nr:Lrp/AsnC family transcriptional regulator [Candidatus Ornithomonoglobus intestinigallinarum]
MRDDILRILDKEKNGVVRAKIAQMLGIDEEEVNKEIKALEDDNVIVGYKTLINWDKTDCEVVTALIELRVTPQRGEGFDRIADRIYKYPQVKSLFLMSGAYDLAVTIQGRSMKEVALFVAQKLAPMDSIISTATHFVLKKYKEEGIVFEDDEKDTRQVITL